jgi:DNA-binding NtrC family response regulator
MAFALSDSTMLTSLASRTPIATSLTAPVRVLVMDAEPLVRWSLCTALAGEGFDPVAAGDAATARQLAADSPPPRIAVIDHGAEHNECLDILTTLRAFYPACRCIVMSTERQPTLPAPFTNALQVIHKPYDLAQVISLVRALADGEPVPTEVVP